MPEWKISTSQAVVEKGHKVNFVAVIACKTSNKCQGQQTTTTV